MPRKVSTDQQAQRHAREARKHAKTALAVLVTLMKTAKDEKVRQAAAARVMDIAFGRPGTQPAGEAAAIQIKLIPGDEAL